jgi:hypothetical protein
LSNKNKKKLEWCLASIFFLILGIKQSSFAAEFFIDNAAPTAYKRVFLDSHVRLSSRKDRTLVQVPALEVDVGIFPDYQVRAVIPASILARKNLRTEYAYGDIRLEINHALIHETEWFPQIALFPKVLLPTGYQQSGFTSTKVAGIFPCLIQKSWGDWKIIIGGGYTIDPNPGQFSYPFGGVRVQWQVTKNLLLGNELFAQGARNLTFGSELLNNFGGRYFLTPQNYILFSAGHSIAGAKELIGFLGLGITWGPLPGK